MAAVWLRSALMAYAHIFPREAPPPTVASLIVSLGDRPGIVAIEDGAIVGLVQPHEGWLTHLYVDPPNWGRGIGAALHDAAVDALRAEGCRSASLWVLEHNQLARSMYERRGWVPNGDTRPVYEHVIDVGYQRAP